MRDRRFNARRQRRSRRRLSPASDLHCSRTRPRQCGWRSSSARAHPQVRASSPSSGARSDNSFTAWLKIVGTPQRLPRSRATKDICFVARRRSTSAKRTATSFASCSCAPKASSNFGGGWQNRTVHDRQPGHESRPAQRTHIVQQADPDRFVVDESARAAVGRDDPPQNDLSVARDAILGYEQARRMPGLADRRSQRRNPGLRRRTHAGASAGTRARGQAQRVQKNGFSRRRFRR
jgi:hypothetical protein